ncbi:MAG: hypothetical protein JWM74_3644 [Myxococcaceae bacterium]|nr:hypothetical protein [Myxococcaceae bacterium]
MSEQPQAPEEDDKEPIDLTEPDSKTGDAIRSLLKRTAGAPLAERDAPSLLPAVQRKIRQRSRGKFFADGWSTTQTRISYVTVSLIMLLILGCAYFALGPTGFH